jgi:hypothetical protein
MSLALRIGSAVREGRIQHGVRRRWLTCRAVCREHWFRWKLGVRAQRPASLPSIALSAGAPSSEETRLLKSAFDAACGESSDLPANIRAIAGMSGQRYRSFINAYVRAIPDARYLEVGSWAGSTAAAALVGNRAKALCIDNWSEFGGPREVFFSNIALALSDRIDFRFIESDFRVVDYASIGSFNVYLFDGPHEEADQYDGVVLAQPALTDRFLLVVDDWNWRAVRVGTFNALAGAGCTVEDFIEVRTTLNDDHPESANEQSDWHNGYFLAVVAKRRVAR